MTTINLLEDFIPSAQHAAILDGTSTYDVTADIQAAFDVAGRKVVQFPSGRVCQSDRIYLTQHNMTVMAYGCELLHIGQNKQCSLWFQGFNNWKVFGLRVNANMPNRVSASPGEGEAGVYVLGSENFVLRDFESVLTYSDGITMGGTSSDPTTRSRVGFLQNVKTEANGRNGISICGAYDILGEHVQAKGNNFSSPKAGIAFETDYGLVNQNITLIGASATYCGGHGLYLNGASTNVGINLLGGRFQNNGGYGISKGGANPSVIGSFVMGSNGSGDWGA